MSQSFSHKKEAEQLLVSEFQNWWNLCALHWMKMLVIENIQYEGSDYPVHFFDHTEKTTLHILRWNIRSLQSVFVASGNPNIYTQMFIFNIVTLLRLHKVCTALFKTDERFRFGCFESVHLLREALSLHNLLFPVNLNKKWNKIPWAHM